MALCSFVTKRVLYSIDGLSEVSMGSENGRAVRVEEDDINTVDAIPTQAAVTSGQLFKALTDLHSATMAQHDKSFTQLTEVQKDSTDRIVKSMDAVHSEIKTQGRLLLGLAILGMLGVLAMAGAKLSGAVNGVGGFDVGHEPKDLADVIRKEEGSTGGGAAPLPAVQP